MKVLIRKRIGNQVRNLYPETYADVVMYNSSVTVADIISSILLDIADIKEKLGINDTVYALDSLGMNITDADGDNIILLSSGDTQVVQNSNNSDPELDDGNQEDLVVSE